MTERPFLEFESYGSSADTLVLLVSGAGAPMQFWPEVFCRRLAEDGFQVVRYSHRDTGRSTHYDRPYSIDVLLDDMVALLARFECAPAHLVGHSLGGYLAQLAICRFPGRFASATAVSSGPTVTADLFESLGMTGPDDECWEILMRNVPTGDFDEDLDGWLRSWRYLNGSRPFDEALAEAYTKALYVGDPRNCQVARNHIHAMTTVPERLVDDLRTAGCSLLVIHGEEDPLVPVDNGAASARLAPDATFHSLEGAGHMFFCDSTWTEIARAVLAHFDRIGAGPGVAP